MLYEYNRNFEKFSRLVRVGIFTNLSAFCWNRFRSNWKAGIFRRIDRKRNESSDRKREKLAG